MSLRTQSDRLAAQGAAFRRALASIQVIWNGKTYCVACTGIRESREIEPGGFEVQPDATLRIPTAIYPAFDPALGDSLTIGTTTVMVTSKTPLLLAGEIKLELGKA